MLAYPSVRLRMDFRDPNIVGTFVYHCHVLEHEDGGMMGRIKVVPANTATSTTPSNLQHKGEL
jgi:FtsP/CotA-like multicopper oxidase with cupredoxin domain